MFLKNSFRNANRVSKSLDSDQARHVVGPDLGLNCLQRLFQKTAKVGFSKERVKELFACLFCCFTSQSTAMVMGGWSVHLITIFPGQA